MLWAALLEQDLRYVKCLWRLKAAAVFEILDICLTSGALTEKIQTNWR